MEHAELVRITGGLGFLLLVALILSRRRRKG